jgi:hypothetical protein
MAAYGDRPDGMWGLFNPQRHLELVGEGKRRGALGRQNYAREGSFTGQVAAPHFREAGAPKMGAAPAPGATSQAEHRGFG